jgi:predicted transporter
MTAVEKSSRTVLSGVSLLILAVLVSLFTGFSTATTGQSAALVASGVAAVGAILLIARGIYVKRHRNNKSVH